MPDVLFQPARILVTGGAGFIGAHLCARLLAEGHRVICLDNLHTGMRRNLRPFERNPRFALIERDVAEPFEAEVDAIFNLACPASPVHYQTDPVRTVRTAVMGAASMLELARRQGCPILQASTSEVYGDPLAHPQPESYWGNVNPIGPRACYDEGKRCAETLFFDYSRQYAVQIRVARIFNTYGPGMHPGDGRVVSNFILQALRGRDVTVQGTGSQTRSFCYVDDLVTGLVRLMRAPDSVAGPVNLGNPEEVTIRDLAERVIALTGSQSRIVETPLPPDDPRQRRPDIGLAERLLGWAPTVGLKDGLARTVAHFRALLAESGPADWRPREDSNPQPWT